MTNEHPQYCLEEQPPHILFAPYLCSLVKEIIIGKESNPLLKAQKIYHI